MFHSQCKHLSTKISFQHDKIGKVFKHGLRYCPISIFTPNIDIAKMTQCDQDNTNTANIIELNW